MDKNDYICVFIFAYVISDCEKYCTYAIGFIGFCEHFPFRMQVGQYVTVNGEVVSHLNISAVHTNDGGLYACVASSTVGSVRYAARLNVYGLPYIR